MPIVKQVEKPPWAANHDFYAAPHAIDLGIPAYAAIDGYTSNLAVSAQVRNRLIYLFGKLSGGFYDQDPPPVRRAFSQMLQNGQQEGCSLSSSGVGQP